MTRRRASPEQHIQRAVCEHLRVRGAPSVLWFAVPNGGRRSPIEGAIFAGLGVRAGVSDLVLLHRGRAFALELKTNGGRPTTAQMQFLYDFRAAGGEASITHGLDQALCTLERWGLLRGEAQTLTRASPRPSGTGTMTLDFSHVDAGERQSFSTYKRYLNGFETGAEGNLPDPGGTAVVISRTTRDRAAVLTVVLEQICDTVQGRERWRAVEDYLRDEVADIERQIAADRESGDA